MEEKALVVKETPSVGRVSSLHAAWSASTISLFGRMGKSRSGETETLLRIR